MVAPLRGARYETRMRRWCHAVLVLLTLGAAGCGGETISPDAGSEPLSNVELGWVRAYSRWTIDVTDEKFDLGPGAALVRECQRRLDAVGKPPTERLQDSAARAADVCPLLARPGSTRRAFEVVDDADDLIGPYLLESRLLPLRSGRTRQSRADIDFSDVASRWTTTPVEVRCWTHGEWLRMVREENAWQVATDDPENFVGFSDEETSRIDMRLDDCNLLVRLRSEDALGWGQDAQEEVADAADTLTHEIQHFLLPDADEADVICAALGTVAGVATDLGASAAEAEALARIDRTEIYPELDAEYRGGGDCDA